MGLIPGGASASARYPPVNAGHRCAEAVWVETLQTTSETQDQPTWSPPHRNEAARARRAASDLARWILLVIFAVAAPVALLLWAAMPRVTDPDQVAEAAVDLGITAVIRGAFIDELGNQLAERRNSPGTGESMELAFEHALTQDWFDDQIGSIAGEIDRWFAGNQVSPPQLMVDLAPVKIRLAADPLALTMVGEMLECQNCDDEATVGTALQQVPDELRLIEDAAPSEEMLRARDTLQTGRRIRDMLPIGLLAVVVLIVLLARRGTRLRWAGYAALVAGIPLLAFAAAAPTVISEQAVGSLPAAFPIRAGHVEDLAGWVFEPASTLALTLVVAGVVLVVVSLVWGAIQRRTV